MAFPNLSSQTIATQLEQVDPRLPAYVVARQSAFARMFKRMNPMHQISAWTAGTVGSGGVSAWRIPVLQWRGGDYGLVSLDGGDMGNGSMMNTQFMTLPFYEKDTAFYIPYRAQKATASKQQAITNVLSTTLAYAIDETAVYMEIDLFQTGNGVLGTGSGTGAAPSGTNPTYNLESAAFGFIRFRGQNQLVDVYSNDGTTKKTATPVRISAIGQSFSSPTVSLTGTVTTPANNDVIAYPGMSPTLSTTSFSSGIYSYNNNQTSGSVNGLARSNVYELNTSAVNVGGTIITPTQLFSGKELAVQRRDPSAMAGMIGVVHPAQRAAWYSVGLTIANNYIRNGEGVKSTDMAGQGTDLDDTFDAADIKHSCSIRADRSQWCWLCPRDYGRVQVAPVQFFTNPDGGQRIYVLRNATTGNPAAGWQFYIVNTENLYTVDPGNQVNFYNCGTLGGE